MRSLTPALTSLLMLLPCAARAQANVLASGVYGDGMIVAYDPTTRTVSGYFYAERDGPGGPAQFSCIFYLTGTLNDGAAAVSSYFPETPTEDLIKGDLVVENPKQFHLQLAQEHGGCWNVEHFADADAPATFALESAHPWMSIAVIRADKAYFYDTPGAATHRKGFVVKGDGVGVRAIREGWLQVDFVGGKGAVTGWVKASDVY